MTILALDAGTTSTRAMLFDRGGGVLARAQKPFAQHFPQDGWVEHDAEEIWSCTIACARDVLSAAPVDASAVAAIGIAVQRETVVVWDRRTGVPVHRAIVWQDRRTAARCRALAEDAHAAALVKRTGLLLDAYFSATKIAWILDQVPGARARAERGELLAGTIDSWLLWKLTGGTVHATDATNASRTLLFDIDACAWSAELCELFDVPMGILPEVRDSADDFGVASAEWLGAPVPVRAMIGDQQAGAVGQECVAAGQAKATYGTGCFVLVHTGGEHLRSRHRLLSTIALRVGGRTTYALEGSIFNAGSVMQWLRDRVGMLPDVAESGSIAAGVASSGGVYLVPAFTGLGAPWWDPDARGALIGLTRDSGRAEIIRAALESVAYQTRDLAQAFAKDGVPLAVLRVDGGMAENDWLMQRVANQVGVAVERPTVVETTAWGAARLAGMHAGVYPALGNGSLRRVNRTFTPSSDREGAGRDHAGWLAAVARVRGPVEKAFGADDLD